LSTQRENATLSKGQTFTVPQDFSKELKAYTIKDTAPERQKHCGNESKEI